MMRCIHFCFYGFFGRSSLNFVIHYTQYVDVKVYYNFTGKVGKKYLKLYLGNIL